MVVSLVFGLSGRVWVSDERGVLRLGNSSSLEPPHYGVEEILIDGCHLDCENRRGTRWGVVTVSVTERMNAGMNR
jgi:hypothetical protein